MNRWQRLFDMWEIEFKNGNILTFGQWLRIYLFHRPNAR